MQTFNYDLQNVACWAKNTRTCSVNTKMVQIYGGMNIINVDSVSNDLLMNNLGWTLIVTLHLSIYFPICLFPSVLYLILRKIQVVFAFNMRKGPTITVIFIFLTIWFIQESAGTYFMYVIEEIFYRSRLGL